MLKKLKILIALTLLSLSFTSCNVSNAISSNINSSTSSSSSEVLPCTHSNVQEDEEKEPTKKEKGYTAGHSCADCGEILDGHDTLVYKEINLTNFTPNIKGDSFNLKYDDFSFKGGYLTTDNNSVTLQYRGTFTNQTMFYRLKKLSFYMSITYGLVYLTYGDSALPLGNETKIEKYSYSQTFENNERYFLLSNHGNIKVTISNINIVCYMLESGEEERSKLPNINIVTENNKAITNKEDYVNSVVSVTDPTNSDNNIMDAVAGIRLRGNSTMSLPKKPYRIKFDKKQSMFGLTKNKSWVLLAEWYDPTNMHNFLAQKINGMFENNKVVLHPIHITVTLNGEYQGLYVLMEHPDEKEGRVNISQDITTDMKPSDLYYMIEQDARAATDGRLNIDYVTITRGGESLYFEIKYPEIDNFPDYNETNNTSKMFSEFVSYLKQEILNAWNALEERNVTDIKNIFDMDSLYNQAMLDLFVDERDHFSLSVKFFKDSTGKIHFGPVWDYDSTAFGFKWDVSYYKDPFNEKDIPYYFTSNRWLRIVTNEILATKTEFKKRFKEFYTTHLDDILELFHKEQSYIANEVMNDAVLWKEDNISIIFENYRFLKYFLTHRYDEVMANI